MGDSLPSIDLVIPVYNEQDVLPLFHARLCAVVDALPYALQIIYVNDGSKDGTGDQLAELAARDARVTVLELSRNFGHQAALTAGIDYSRAQTIITLDGDGEHPVELIPEMIALAERGYDMVLTQRQEDQQAGLFKRRTSALFYRLINGLGSTQILPGSADFRLMNRTSVDALRSMREYQRFLRGMVAWMGYKTIILPYQPTPRLGGRSKYSLRQMLNLASNAIFSFSLVPLYLSISLGGIFLLLALIEVFYVLSFWISGQQATLAPGWSSLMFVLLFVGGSILVMLGIVGLYIGYIFQEVKQRPIYLVRQTLHRNGSDD